MASWTLVPCLVVLREEFDTLAPNRDKSSDGSIGDSAHASSSSDHNPDETGATPYEDADNINEVHAIDVDANLNLSGWTMTRAVNIIVERHRVGVDDRLQNVIYNKKVWSRSWGWTEREYTGSNPHDGHAHFSSRYTLAEETDERPWGLLKENMMNHLPRKGDEGESVKYWQYVLTRIGYPNLVADGDYGSATAAAIKDYWVKAAKPSNTNAFDGSYISGWLAMKMDQELARVSVPKPTEITQDQVNIAVKKYFEDDGNLPAFDISGDFDGKVTLR